MSEHPMAENAKIKKTSRGKQRQARLAEQLRSNLKKRKQQARYRAQAEKPAEKSRA